MADNEYEDKSSEIRQLGSLPPDQLSDHLSQLHPRLSAVAPNLAPHVHATTMNAIQFLNSKLPPSGNELMQDAVPMISPAQKNAWLGMHKTVNDPLSVLDHIEQGTLTGHHLEALKSVYPDLHQEMSQKIQEQLGQMKMKGKELPYAKRLAISKFIGQPLDSTMTQPNMQAIINSANQNIAPQTQPAKKASGVELNQLNKVNSLDQTSLQARQAQSKA